MDYNFINIKNYKLIERLKAQNIADKKREFKKWILYIQEKYKGKEMCPDLMRSGRELLSKVDDWSLVEAI